jgi:UDP-galactopyranose mutase
MYDYLIVGSGLFGSVFANEAVKNGKRCLVIDKRSHVGGNVFTENIEGINVHKYGAHIFHTNNKFIWDYVSNFVEFNRYTNSPIANYKDVLYNLPFNMNTFYQLWGVTTPQEAYKKIEEERSEFKHIINPRNLEEQALVLGGRDIYEKLIKGYTEKQWGRKATEIPAFIIRRLPFRFTFDNNYFNDNYQGIPIGGYTKLIEELLRGSDVRLRVDFFKDKSKPIFRD